MASARNTDVELLTLFGKPGLVYSGADRNVQRHLDRREGRDLPRGRRLTGTWVLLPG